MRKAITGLALSSIMVISVAAGASAGPGYGRIIREQCGMSFGQLVSAVRSGRTEHAPFRVRGARHFVRTGLIDEHCPVAPQMPETPEYPEAPES